MNYQKNTLGYHYEMAKTIFGESSRPAKFLKGKADESPNGFNEGCIASEGQVMMLLFHLHQNDCDENDFLKINKI